MNLLHVSGLDAKDICPQTSLLKAPSSTAAGYWHGFVHGFVAILVFLLVSAALAIA